MHHYRTWLRGPAVIGLSLSILFSYVTEAHAQRGKLKELSEGDYQSSILFVGDSHTVQTFGQTMDELLRTIHLPKLQVSTYGRCGASASAWFLKKSTKCGAIDHLQGEEVKKVKDGVVVKIPNMLELVKKHQPNWIVIALGANQYKATSARTRMHVSELVRLAKAGDAQCIWIGPPNGRNKPEPRMSELYEDLDKATEGKCFFIDSRPVTYYPEVGGDGAHFGSLGPEGIEMGRNWAKAIFHQVQDVIARHPNR